jgi:hypothetical protein
MRPNKLRRELRRANLRAAAVIQRSMTVIAVLP